MGPALVKIAYWNVGKITNTVHLAIKDKRIIFLGKSY